jgi:hypothetical protein
LRLWLWLGSGLRLGSGSRLCDLKLDLGFAAHLADRELHREISDEQSWQS